MALFLWTHCSNITAQHPRPLTRSFTLLHQVAYTSVLRRRKRKTRPAAVRGQGWYTRRPTYASTRKQTAAVITDSMFEQHRCTTPHFILHTPFHGNPAKYLLVLTKINNTIRLLFSMPSQQQLLCTGPILKIRQNSWYLFYNHKGWNERSYNWHCACQTTLLLRDSLSLSRSFVLWPQPWNLSTIMSLWHSFLIIIIIIK